MKKYKDKLIPLVISMMVISLNFNISAQENSTEDTKDDFNLNVIDNENNYDDESSEEETSEAEVETESKTESENGTDSLEKDNEKIDNHENDESEIDNEKNVVESKENEQKTEKNQKVIENEKEDVNSTVSVDDWDSFKDAYANEDVRKIVLNQDLELHYNNTFDLLSDRTESIMIDGKGHTINTQAGAPNNYVLFNLKKNRGDFSISEFSIKDINFIHGSSYIINTNETYGGWNLSIQNVTNDESEQKGGFANGESIKEVKLRGNFHWESSNEIFNVQQGNIISEKQSNINTKSVGNTFVSKSLHFIGTNAKLMKTGIGSVAYARIEEKYITDSSKESFIKFEDSTIEVEDTSLTGSTFKVGNVSTFSQKAQFIVDNTDLRIKDNLHGHSDGDSTIKITGKSENNNPSGLFVTNQSTVDIVTNGGQALSSQIANGAHVRIEDPNTSVNFATNENSVTVAPLIKIFKSGNNQLLISNKAHFNVISSNSKSQELVTIHGGGNKIEVNSGGKFYIKNEAEPTKNTNKNALTFKNVLRNTNENNVLVKGIGSELFINANSGMAIDSRESDLKITGKEEANLQILGNTSFSVQAVITAKKLKMKLVQVDYYDIKNSKSEGGYLFKTSEDNSKYDSALVEVEVWNRGSNLDADPDKYWKDGKFILSGKDFSNIFVTNNQDPNNDIFVDGGMTAYSRIRGSNSRKVETSPKVHAKSLYITKENFMKDIKDLRDLIELMEIKGIDENYEEISYELETIEIENSSNKEESLDFANPEPGMYNVTANLKIDNNISASKNLYISNYDNVREENGFIIEANNFVIPDYIAANIEEEEILERSKARAWKIKDINEVDQEKEEYKVEMITFNVRGIPGKYNEKLKVINNIQN